MQTVNQQKAELDDVERKSLRTAMIEDRTRYCQFVNMLQPVVKQEYEMMYELGHLQVRIRCVGGAKKKEFGSDSRQKKSQDTIIQPVR